MIVRGSSDWWDLRGCCRLPPTFEFFALARRVDDFALELSEDLLVRWRGATEFAETFREFYLSLRAGHPTWRVQFALRDPERFERSIDKAYQVAYRLSRTRWLCDRGRDSFLDVLDFLWGEVRRAEAAGWSDLPIPSPLCQANPCEERPR